MDLRFSPQELAQEVFKNKAIEHRIPTIVVPSSAVILLQGVRYLAFPYAKGLRASKTTGAPTRQDMIDHKVVKRLKIVLQLFDWMNGAGQQCRKAVYRIDFHETDHRRCPYIGWTGAWKQLYPTADRDKYGYVDPERLDIDDVAEAWYASGFMLQRKVANVRAYEAYRLLGQD